MGAPYSFQAFFSSLFFVSSFSVAFAPLEPVLDLQQSHQWNALCRNDPRCTDIINTSNAAQMQYTHTGN